MQGRQRCNQNFSLRGIPVTFKPEAEGKDKARRIVFPVARADLLLHLEDLPWLPSPLPQQPPLYLPLLLNQLLAPFGIANFYLYTAYTQQRP